MHRLLLLAWSFWNHMSGITHSASCSRQLSKICIKAMTQWDQIKLWITFVNWIYIKQSQRMFLLLMVPISNVSDYVLLVETVWFADHHHDNSFKTNTNLVLIDTTEEVLKALGGRAQTEASQRMKHGWTKQSSPLTVYIPRLMRVGSNQILWLTLIN